ncbi:hypothetical protein H072_2301 [Dactylellina haptotyla CBS 200.50]|uniref:Carbohydrate esterase family 16 protein n=1 Tax=Dactylellina haptotyla (strain CBS 200.50) TaxID=1284197 RepID=S8BW20_DACHA|nr:hypothetical protein H072_2301 [Dactylellina haptotyla CBS 200.50]
MKSTLAFAAFAGLATLANAAPALEKRVFGRHYNGFDRIKYLFVFGDSYTSTGFNMTNGSPLPTPENPMGNPPFPGWNSANGPNWVDYLTFTYNSSLLQTWNLAYGGATIDSALVTPWRDDVLSLKQQVQDLFLPYLSTPPDRSAHSPFPRWKSDTSLFLTWIGINDIGNSWWYQNTTFHDVLMDEYFLNMGSLYDAGARNFVFINVPPVDRSPLMLDQGDWSTSTEKMMLKDFNDKLVTRVANFEKEHRGTSTWVFDSVSIFNYILDHPETAEWDFKNVTGYCDSYQNGTPEWDTFAPECTYPVDEYFWLNSLHPTHWVHNQVAKKLAAVL